MNAIDWHNPAPQLDELAQDVARTLPVGSAAGGEQPKFTATMGQNKAVLVKFSPPRGTPFGERWSDLLNAEALCNQVLRSFGFDVADSCIVQSTFRTYLISKRFDRVGASGRKHIVSIGAAHQAFVKNAYVNWVATADALARRGQLAASDAAKLQTIFQFGKLIGNTDMHSGNAGLFVAGTTLKDIGTGHFSLAPVYDMLPMRWKPDPMLGALDYAPFEADFSLADKSTRAAAQDFWLQLSQHPQVSPALQQVAAVMTSKMGA